MLRDYTVRLNDGTTMNVAGKDGWVAARTVQDFGETLGVERSTVHYEIPGLPGVWQRVPA